MKIPFFSSFLTQSVHVWFSTQLSVIIKDWFVIESYAYILYACPSVETLQAYLEGFYVFQLPLLISKMLHAATL